MAEPLSASRVMQALLAEGCKVGEVRSWRTHNRGNRGTGWGPVNGVMLHHTVTSGTASTVRLCYDGYTALPGPLCHGVIGKDGVVYMVGWGRANHAGLGDDNVLDAVIREDGSLPAPNERNADGNSRFYGFECENRGDGDDPWPPVQLDAIERASAALCRAHGWSAESVIGHKEWSYTKIDPRGFSMKGMRRRIADRLNGAAGDDMALSNDDINKIADRVYEVVFERDGVIVPGHWGAPGNTKWKYRSIIASDGDRQRRIESKVEELGAAVSRLNLADIAAGVAAELEKKTFRLDDPTT